MKSLQGVVPIILGQDEGEYTGLSDKPRILYNAINNGVVKSDVIVFVDAWDVVFAAPVSYVVDDWSSQGGATIIGAEKNCFPQNFKKEYDRLKASSSYKYLNSGVIVGYRDAIMEILLAMDAPNLPQDYHDGRNGRNYHFNDQAYYMDIFLRQPVEMKLDYDCRIVQNMQDVTEDDLSFTELGIKNNETQSLPSIIHWNGASKDKWSRSPILNHLKLLP